MYNMHTKKTKKFSIRFLKRQQGACINNVFKVLESDIACGSTLKQQQK